MKVIFLDFDGVITSDDSNWSLMQDKMDLVKHICDETGAKIVISSSWRTCNLKTTLKYATAEGTIGVGDAPYSLTEYTIDITPCYYWEPISMAGISTRGGEIETWLKRNISLNIENYVILDDDNDMLDSQQTHLVLTSWEHGISEADTERAINILNA